MTGRTPSRPAASCDCTCGPCTTNNHGYCEPTDVGDGKLRMRWDRLAINDPVELANAARLIRTARERRIRHDRGDHSQCVREECRDQRWRNR